MQGLCRLGVVAKNNRRARFTVRFRVPPRAHSICSFFSDDFLVPVNENLPQPSSRCPHCRKRERYSACRKIKKSKHFYKDANLRTLVFKTCDTCRLQAEAAALGMISFVYAQFFFFESSRITGITRRQCRRWCMCESYQVMSCPKRRDSRDMSSLSGAPSRDA